MARKKHYVNNKDMHEALCNYLNACSESEENHRQEPRVSEYLGHCFYILCERIATKPNFSGYSYIDEMKGDGMENCIMQVKSYNPQKSNNAFAYFSTIIHNAFVRRIKREKRQHLLKIENLELLCVHDEIAGMTQKAAHNEITDAYVRSFDKDREKEGKKKRPMVRRKKTSAINIQEIIK